MITHNICIHGEIRKILIIFGLKKHLIKSYGFVLVYRDKRAKMRPKVHSLIIVLDKMLFFQSKSIDIFLISP